MAYETASERLACDLSGEQKKKIFANLGVGQIKGSGPKGFFAVGEKDKKLTIEDEATQKGTVYFKHCKNSTFELNGRSARVFIEGCHDCTFVLNGSIITSTMEVWRCKGITLQLNRKVETIQADLNKDFNIEIDLLENFGSVVWAGCHNMNISFGDMGRVITTGVEQMKSKEANKDMDEHSGQIITRIIDGALMHERVVRVGSGYVSTQREKIEHEEREKRNLELGKRTLGLI